ncbi:MAG TPA: hypothetical protein VK892_01205 [Pyrinomonadaceae bacterium]|nr:hypothetical protein [Pyrinomonadaceae bacterium]
MQKKKLLTEIAQEPKRRPYGAKVKFLLSNEVEVKIDGDVSLIVVDDMIITLGLSSEQPYSPNNYLQRYEATIEGFTTATEAEEKGFKLTLALLWASISHRFPMRLDYDTSLPYIIYNRISSNGGLSFRADFRLLMRTEINAWAELLNEAITTSSQVDNNLLLSMEIFSSANLEMTERTKFISLVSSLEPLSIRNDYPDSIQKLIDVFKKELQNLDVPEISEENKEEINKLKNSLKGRLNELKSESIRQSLLRTVHELLPNESDALQIIDDAYNLRSKILHEGATDPYLSSKSQKVSEIIRKLFAARIGKTLKY